MNQTALSNADARSQLTTSNRLELLCFNVGASESLYAINVFKVREVVRRESYAIDRAADSGHANVVGMIDHRIGLLPIIDLAAWLGEGSGRQDDKIIICEYNKSNVGLLASREASIVRKGWDEIHVPPPSLLETGKISNTTRIPGPNNKDRVVYILDVEQLLQEIAPRFSNMDDVQVEHVISPGTATYRKILVAEDSRIARKQITRQFDLMGVEDYIVFQNGKEILEYLNSDINIDGIGMIITDLEMPEVSGFTVIKEVKANPKLKHIPVIVNSSMSEQNNEREARELGAAGFIPKISPQMMVGAIQNHALRVA